MHTGGGSRMTKSKRVIDVIFGIAMFAVGVALFIVDTKYSLTAVLAFIQIGMSFRGLRLLYYYLTMARHMVGGKNVLYRSFIMLDLGTMAGSLIGHELSYTVFYLALLHIFTGAVSMLRANESRRYGARWRMKMAFGVTNVLLAIAVVVGSVVFREPLITVGIYGAGLIYSAVLRIASAFKRTDIVYIQ